MSKLDLIAPDSPEAALSRRSLVQTIAGTALAMTFLAGCGGSDDDDDNNGNGGGTSGSTGNDVAILQFALNLEYLEAEFYAFATTGSGLPTTSTSGGLGTFGATTNGVRTTFSSTYGAAIAQEIAGDEKAHVDLLRGALAANSITKPAININPLGLDLTTEEGFLTLARAFEDVGVTAYLGAAPAISPTGGYLPVAAAILAVEALHTGNIRLQLVELGAPSGSSLDDKDAPPSSSNFFATTPNSLAFARTPREVLRIVYNNASPTAPGGFFPSGVNLGAGNAERLLALG